VNPREWLKTANGSLSAFRFQLSAIWYQRYGSAAAKPAVTFTGIHSPGIEMAGNGQKVAGNSSTMSDSLLEPLPIAVVEGQ
jgi:hypothetical protein